MVVPSAASTVSSVPGSAPVTVIWWTPGYTAKSTRGSATVVSGASVLCGALASDESPPEQAAAPKVMAMVVAMAAARNFASFMCPPRILVRL